MPHIPSTIEHSRMDKPSSFMSPEALQSTEPLMPFRARVLLLFITLVVGSNLGVAPAHGASLTTHSPIVITSDGGFTAGNGITGGSGIRSDPYIISGWNINSTTSSSQPQYGISIRNTRDYFIVRSVNVYGKTGVSLDLQNVTNAAVQASILSNSGGGVEIFSSSNITLSNDNIEFDRIGVSLAFATNITLQGNIFTSDGIYVSPSQTDARAWNSYTITQDNLVNGRPIRFLKNCSQVTVNGDLLGQLILANCTGVTVRNLTIGNTASGIQLANVSDFLVANVTLISNRQDGMAATAVTNGTMTDVTASYSGTFGLEMWMVNNVTLSNGNFSSNEADGVVLDGSNYVTVSSSIISNNKRWGLVLSYSQNSSVFHNDFINNSGPSCPPVGGVCSSAVLQVQYATAPSGSDTWDAGYPSGGNYWSDYVGVDVCSGPLQSNCNRCGPSFQDPCADGIGDTPRLVQQYDIINPTDRYPLMKPYHPDTTPPSWPSNAYSGPSMNYAYLKPTSAWLYWTQATDDVKVTAYRLYVDNVLIATLPGGQFFYNATWLTPGATYKFQVVAVDVDGNTSPPLATSVITPTVQLSTSNNIPNWYLLPIGLGATAGVVGAVLLTRRHYRKEEGRINSNPE